VERRYVGIDLHRRRSVIYSMDADGEKLDCVRIANDPLTLLETVSKTGSDAEVVIEATYGWYWAVDLLQEAGFRVHLAHPSGNDWGNRRVKNDERDARDLADLLRLGRLAEAWIAPPAVREVRELVRYRAKLVQLRSGLKAQVHAVMAKEGVLPTMTDMFCQAGQRHLDRMQLADVYVIRVESLRDLIERYDREVAMLERKIHQLLRDDPGYQAIQALNGVGRTIAAIFVAEIGDVGRFRSAEALCSRAGLAPWHRGVRHQSHPPRDHQDGITARALGRARSHRPLPRRVLAAERLPSHRPAAGQEQSPRRRSPQVAHARLLRPARRRDPLPARRPRGGVRRSDTTPRRARVSAWLPAYWRSRGM
jgi:transposase